MSVEKPTKRKLPSDRPLPLTILSFRPLLIKKKENGRNEVSRVVGIVTVVGGNYVVTVEGVGISRKAEGGPRYYRF